MTHPPFPTNPNHCEVITHDTLTTPFHRAISSVPAVLPILALLHLFQSAVLGPTVNQQIPISQSFAEAREARKLRKGWADWEHEFAHNAEPKFHLGLDVLGCGGRRLSDLRLATEGGHPAGGRGGDDRRLIFPAGLMDVASEHRDHVCGVVVAKAGLLKQKNGSQRRPPVLKTTLSPEEGAASHHEDDRHLVRLWIVAPLQGSNSRVRTSPRATPAVPSFALG